MITTIPAAVRREVRVRALTTALVAPVFSSCRRQTVTGQKRLRYPCWRCRDAHVVTMVVREGVKHVCHEVLEVSGRQQSGVSFDVLSREKED